MSTFRQQDTGDKLPNAGLDVTVESMDLTSGQCFDWTRYLVNHLVGRDAVGRGVTNFEVHRQRRLDFVVHRVDGSCPHVLPYPTAFSAIHDWQRATTRRRPS